MNGRIEVEITKGRLPTKIGERRWLTVDVNIRNGDHGGHDPYQIGESGCYLRLERLQCSERPEMIVAEFEDLCDHDSWSIADDARRLHVNADELTEAILVAIKEIADERSERPA